MAEATGEEGGVSEEPAVWMVKHGSYVELWTARQKGNALAQVESLRRGYPDDVVTLTPLYFRTTPDKGDDVSERGRWYVKPAMGGAGEVWEKPTTRDGDGGYVAHFEFLADAERIAEWWNARLATPTSRGRVHRLTWKLHRDAGDEALSWDRPGYDTTVGWWTEKGYVEVGVTALETLIEQANLASYSPDSDTTPKQQDEET